MADPTHERVNVVEDVCPSRLQESRNLGEYTQEIGNPYKEAACRANDMIVRESGFRQNVLQQLRVPSPQFQ